MSTLALSTPHLPTPTRQACFKPMAQAHLDAVVAIDQQVYGHPWSRGNFADSLAVGYHAQCLLASVPGRLLGYFVAMAGWRETHLLNITVAPDHQGHGWGGLMLDALILWSRAQQAENIWLEVRASNHRAAAVYQHLGFFVVGTRKNYYLTGHRQREDALVMQLPLVADEPTP